MSEGPFVLRGSLYSEIGLQKEACEKLMVSVLLDAGFEEFACWDASDHRLNVPANLPKKRGVYAFALGDEVVYVGLASRSISQRLGFYARPGKSQRTNVRLNAMITELIRQGQTVCILLAHPPDNEWNGMRVSGAEGLEAALIEDFDLPWNVSGSKSPSLRLESENQAESGGRRVHGSTPQAVLSYIAENPRCTELEIAKGVFGPDAVQPRANIYCRKLIDSGQIERLPTRPATYVVRA